MAEVTIVPSKGPVHVKQSIGQMPNLVTKASAAVDAPAAPAAPKVSGIPANLKPSAAPPVPPPVKPSVDVRTPEPRKAASEVFEKLRNRGKPAPAAEPVKKDVDMPMPGEHLQDDEKKIKEPEAAGSGEEHAQAEEAAAKPGELDKQESAAPAEGHPQAAAKTKVNPWKLVDEWKAKAAEAEKQLIETKKLIKDEATARAEAERFSAMEKRAKELEDEIRFTNYSKSAEFQEKYHKPYVEGVRRAMGALSGIMVDGPEGEHEITPSDFIKVVNAESMRAASDMAKEMFGDYASDVMIQRNKIREIWDSRVEALERARTEAGEREKQIYEETRKRSEQLQMSAKETWDKLNNVAKSDPENGQFFSEVENDDERNQVLMRGFELFDSATRENPLNPELSQEQRAAIVKKHVAIRNRTAGYGVVKYLWKKATAELQEVRAKLQEYESSVPQTGGTAPASPSTTPTRAIDQVMAELRKRAR
jgi:hypothetical protein